MLEYVFFHDEPRTRFQHYLSELNIGWIQVDGDPESLVQVAEDEVDDALADRIEAVYDELFSADQALYDASLPESAEHYAGSGLVVNLKDGRSVYADLSPALLNRVLSAVSPEELGTLVDAIVSAVENPDERSFCQRMREAGSD